MKDVIKIVGSIVVLALSQQVTAEDLPWMPLTDVTRTCSSQKSAVAATAVVAMKTSCGESDGGNVTTAAMGLVIVVR